MHLGHEIVSLQLLHGIIVVHVKFKHGIIISSTQLFLYRSYRHMLSTRNRVRIQWSSRLSRLYWFSSLWSSVHRSSKPLHGMLWMLPSRPTCSCAIWDCQLHQCTQWRRIWSMFGNCPWMLSTGWVSYFYDCARSEAHCARITSS